MPSPIPAEESTLLAPRVYTLAAVFAVAHATVRKDKDVRLDRARLWHHVRPALTGAGVGRNAFTATLRDLAQEYPDLLTTATGHGHRPLLTVASPLLNTAAWKDAFRSEDLNIAEALRDLGLSFTDAPADVVSKSRVGEGARVSEQRSLDAKEAAEEALRAAGALTCRVCSQTFALDPALDVDAITDDDDKPRRRGPRLEGFSPDGVRARRCRACERARKAAARRRRPRPSVALSAPISSTSSPEDLDALDGRLRAEEDAKRAKRAKEREDHERREAEARAAHAAKVAALSPEWTEISKAITAAERSIDPFLRAAESVRGLTPSARWDAILAARAEVDGLLLAIRDARHELQRATAHTEPYRRDRAPIPSPLEVAA